MCLFERKRLKKINQALFTTVTKDFANETKNLITQGTEVNAVARACCVVKNVVTVKLLVEHGARFDDRPPNGMSPIQFAASERMREGIKVRFFLDVLNHASGQRRKIQFEIYHSRDVLLNSIAKAV